MTDKFVSSHRALPRYFSWGIWLSKNNLIFEDKEAQLGILANHIRVSYGEGRKQPKNIVPISFQELIIDHTKPWGFLMAHARVL